MLLCVVICYLSAGALVDAYRVIFFFSSRRRHTRLVSDWSSDVCSSDLSVIFEFVSQDVPYGFQGITASHDITVGKHENLQITEHAGRLGNLLLPVISREIGRASCRERV